MNQSEERLGLIAGTGDLPIHLARSLVDRGAGLYVVALEKSQYETLKRITPDATLMGVAQVGKIIKTLKENGVTKLCFAGKIDKRILFGNPRFDLTALKIIKNAENISDDGLMNGIVAELEKNGLEVASQEKLLAHLMPPVGIYSRRKPTPEELADIAFGMPMAAGIAALDIGQTVVIRSRSVVAVEAIEGTDEAIRRGGAIANEKGVVCKVSKPNQDPRFDVPTVGVTTIETMASVQATCLAIEAGKTLVVDQEAVTRACDKAGITFVAVDRDGGGL